MDVVAVATPNDSHLRSPAPSWGGISVVCEKPLTQDSSTAAELVRIAAEHDAVLAVPHCYSAYAMVRHAARLVRDGQLGAVPFVDVEHASGWAATPLELLGHKQAPWRTDPDIAGFPSVVGDLGTHAYHLLRYITGLDADRLSARLKTLVPGRRVFDHATVEMDLSPAAFRHAVGQHGRHRPQPRPPHPVFGTTRPGMAARGPAPPHAAGPRRRHPS